VGRAFQTTSIEQRKAFLTFLHGINPTKTAELTTEVKGYVEEAARKDPNLPDHILSDED